MKRLAVLLLLAVSCNPAPRCRTVADCCRTPMDCQQGYTWCSGGFCADGPVPNDREDPVDLDGPDAGFADGGQPALRQLEDGGELWDGRDGG
jgi:hypothetical protein